MEAPGTARRRRYLNQDRSTYVHRLRIRLAPSLVDRQRAPPPRSPQPRSSSLVSYAFSIPPCYSISVTLSLRSGARAVFCWASTLPRPAPLCCRTLSVWASPLFWSGLFHREQDDLGRQRRYGSRILDAHAAMPLWSP